MKKLLFFLLCCIFLAPNNVLSKRLIIGVSIPPQKYFVEKIGGDKVKTFVLLPSGANPVVYEPKPKQMYMLSQAKVFFSMGVPFESAWLKRFKREFPKLSIVKMYQMIKRRPVYKDYMFLNRKVVDRNPDPHIWLSPPLVRVMAITVLNTLISVDSKHRSSFIRNYKDFVEEIDELDKKILSLFLDVKKRCFLVFHPSWSYFAQTYGLKQIPLEIGGKSPTIKDMEFFIDFAKKNRLKTIFVQPQFSTRFAKTLADAIGGKIEFLDPLADNWKDNLLKSALLIKRSLDE